MQGRWDNCLLVLAESSLVTYFIITDSLGHSDLEIDPFIFNLLRSVAPFLLLDTAVLLGAAHTLAVVDDVVWIPVILDFQQSRVDVSKIPASDLSQTLVDQRIHL